MAQDQQRRRSTNNAGAQPASAWTLVGLDTEALFEYMRNGKKHEDLSATITNMVRESVQQVLTAYQLEQGLQIPSGEQASLLLKAQQLYYRTLQHQLQTSYPAVVQEQGRHRHRVVAPAAHQVLQRMDLHLGLLHCTLELVLAGSTDRQQVQGCTPIITAALGTSHSMLSVWEASRWFLDCFTSPATGCSLADTHLYILRAIKLQAEEGLVLAQGSSFYEIVFTGGGSVYTPADMRLVHDFLADVALGVTHRVLQCVLALSEADRSTGVEDPFHSMFIQSSLQLVDRVLSERMDLLFDVHQAVLVACIVYGVAKLHRQDVSFSILTSTLVKVWGPGLPPTTFTAIKVHAHLQWQAPAGKGAAAVLPAAGGSCSVRTFYNGVFLPACEPMLLAIKAQGSSVVDQPMPPMQPLITQPLAGLQASARAQHMMQHPPPQQPDLHQQQQRAPLSTIHAFAVSSRMNSAGHVLGKTLLPPAAGSTHPPASPSAGKKRPLSLTKLEHVAEVALPGHGEEEAGWDKENRPAHGAKHAAGPGNWRTQAGSNVVGVRGVRGTATNR